MEPTRTEPPPPNLAPLADPTPAQLLTARLLATLAAVYAIVEKAEGLPWGTRPILELLRPRLERSLAEQPGRAAAILTYAWANIPRILGDAVDLTDHEKVAATVQLVRDNEGWR